MIFFFAECIIIRGIFSLCIVLIFLVLLLIISIVRLTTWLKVILKCSFHFLQRNWIILVFIENAKQTIEILLVQDNFKILKPFSKLLRCDFPTFVCINKLKEPFQS